MGSDLMAAEESESDGDSRLSLSLPNIDIDNDEFSGSLISSRLVSSRISSVSRIRYASIMIDPPLTHRRVSSAKARDTVCDTIRVHLATPERLEKVEGKSSLSTATTCIRPGQESFRACVGGLWKWSNRLRDDRTNPRRPLSACDASNASSPLRSCSAAKGT